MATETPTPTLPTTGIWELDPYHSTVAYRVTHHAVGSYRDRFTEPEATFDAAAGKLKGSVKVDNMATFDMLKEHLASDDYLAAAKHPTVTFESSSIEADGNKLTVTGDMTLRGVTKQVTATGTFAGPSRVAGWEGAPDTQHIGFDLKTTIDRRDFGVTENNELADGQLNLGWDVEIDFSLEFSSPIE
ncbi:MAG TPA: YceI family protein [Baekduia sp.]|nr:YceI family protein [Baekduia sp.]